MEGGFTFSPDTIDLNSAYGQANNLIPSNAPGQRDYPGPLAQPMPQPAPSGFGAAPAAPQQPGLWDLSQPGAAENQWSNTAQQFFAGPTNSQNAYGTYSPIFQGMATQGGPTYSADAYNMFNAPENAGLDAYYDNAWNDTSDRLNTALAARGEGNSSFATDELRRASVGLGAEQANREADYALRRSQVGGTLAANAGNEQIMGDRANLDAATAGSRLAGDVDSANLQHVIGGMAGGQIAQNAREGRIGDALDNIQDNAMNQVAVAMQGHLSALDAHGDLVNVPHEIRIALEQAAIAGDQAQFNNLLGLGGVVGNFFGGG